MKRQNETLRRRLAERGLIEASFEERLNRRVTLAAFVEQYIARHASTVKPTTVTTWRQCQRLLAEHFPADTLLATIKPGDAVDFRTRLLTLTDENSGSLRPMKPLSEAATRRRCGCAKTFLDYAVAKGILCRNPFDTAKVPTTSPRAKQKHYLAGELGERILDKLPSAQWRLLFALARWGGMRVPSELEALLITDVDWERMRISFRSPKTEHHEGKDRREIRIFPELVQPLWEVFETAERANRMFCPSGATQATATRFGAGEHQTVAQTVERSAGFQTNGIARKLPDARS